MSFPSELSDDVLAEEFATTFPSIDFYHREQIRMFYISRSCGVYMHTMYGNIIVYSPTQYTVQAL